MNRAIHASAAAQTGVGGVDHCIYPQTSNIAAFNSDFTHP